MKAEVFYTKNTFHFVPGLLPAEFARHLGLRNAALVQKIILPRLDLRLESYKMELEVFSNLKEVRMIGFH
jgi:hypothetical protein